MADSLSISSKSTRRLHKLAQKLGSYSPKPSSSNGPAGSGAPELATALSAFTRKVQISPPEPQKQGHPTCAAVSGPIEPKPDPSAGPLEPDSGYGSSESTLATTTGPEKPRSKPTLNVFTKTVPTDVQNRFNDLRVLYAPALLEAVAKTKARNISMKLKYLGQSEETAKLYIVVQCDPGIVKKVERFLSQKHVLEDLGSDFLVDVRGGTLLSLSGSVTIGIWGILEAKATFCGMPILISSGDARRRATFVGLISVTMTRRRTVLYGVTAAHPAADLISRPMSGVDADDCDSDSEEPSQPLLDPSTEVSISQQVEESDALVSESKNLGTITGRGVLRTRDLALIELECEELLPNRISPFQPTAKGGEQRSMADTRMLYRSLDLFASDFQKHSFQACPAAVLTSRGLQYGQISSSRSALTMFLDAEFIEVFDFCPDQGASACHGLSLLGLTSGTNTRNRVVARGFGFLGRECTDRRSVRPRGVDRCFWGSERHPYSNFPRRHQGAVACPKCQTADRAPDFATPVEAENIYLSRSHGAGERQSLQRYPSGGTRCKKERRDQKPEN